MTVTWLVGRFDIPDSSAVVADLRRCLPNAETHRFRSPGEAMTSDAPPPELVVVVQHRPGEFSRRDSEALIGAHPLARFVVGLGPWCGSHGRSERLWPEAATVPLWEIALRLRREVACLAGAASPVPLTAGREDLILAETAVGRPAEPAPAVAAVSRDRAFVWMLNDALREIGALIADPLEAECVLIDVDPIAIGSLDAFSALRLRRPDARLIALTAVPTVQDVDLLRRAGADAVLAKGCGIAEIIAASACRAT